MLAPAIRAYVSSHQDQFLSQLINILKFPSISCQAARNADCLACVEHLAAELRGMGFNCQLRPWRQHPILIGRRNSPTSTKTVLMYGHYDVQPVDPLNLWTTPPFEPAIRDGAIYARGASDDKGQLYAHFKAIEAILATAGELPVNVIVFLEGEEEVGSPELEKFIAASAAELKADCALISDSDFFAANLPSITYGLRGLVYVELTLQGPKEDLHSGAHGGVLINPLNGLARMIAGMHDERGRVSLPGFYDDVLPLSEQERQRWRALPFDERAYAQELGTELAGGERGLELLERRWARPTLDCNGIVGGYQGEGSKTVIPAAATAKISMRLVADQRPEKVIESFRQYVQAHTPPGIRTSLKVSAEGRPVLVSPDGQAVRAASDALKEAFGGEVALIRNGASVPITELFQRVLKIDPVLMGFGLPDDHLHSPNERFKLEHFYKGILASTAFLYNVAR